MKKFMTICAVSALMMVGAAHAGKKATAVTQFQATGSVVTQGTIANAISNASNRGVTVIGVTKTGVQVLVTATTSDGKSVTVPATAVLAGGKVTVTFADGSSTTFDA